MSLARSFFDANKELFEYEKHVGTDDPVALSLRGGIGAKTFLDKYREYEQRQAMELRANLQGPLVVALAVDPAVLARFPVATTLLPTSFPSDFAVGTQQQFDFQQEAPSAPIASLTRSRLENSLRQSTVNSSGDGDQEDAADTAHWPLYSAPAASERLSPTKLPAAPPFSTHVDAATKTTSSSAASRTYSLAYAPPKLSGLLIDSATRSAALRHRHLDEAKKVELLLGTSCGGRISSVSTNLPPSVRRRLQASARVEQRRERLYADLRQHYEAICSPNMMTP